MTSCSIKQPPKTSCDGASASQMTTINQEVSNEKANYWVSQK